jgi:hypothetical protein
MPNRFSEDEARRIFARAAERQHAEDRRPEGLSLAELQEIGRSAGLDPGHVTAAVAEVRAAAPPGPGAELWGVDMEPRAVRVVPGALTDEAWGQMVGRVRPTFRTIGVTNTVGRTREWNGTNSGGGLSNLRMTAEPVEGGTRVVLETSRAGEAAQVRWLPTTFGVIALAFAVGFPLLGEAGAGLVFAGLILALVLGTAFAARVGYARWSAERQGQFEDLLDAFERIVTPEAASDGLAAPAASGAEPPVLNLDALAEPEAGAEATRARGRVR